MKKSIYSILICIAVVLGLMPPAPVSAATATNIAVTQTGKRDVVITGKAPALSDVTLLITPEGAGLGEFFYLRQTAADTGGSFSFRVRLREEDPKTFAVNVSGAGLDIDGSMVFTLSDDYVPDSKETYDRENDIEVDYVQIANVLYLTGKTPAGKKEIAVSVSGADGMLYAAAQITPQDGSFSRTLVLNPDFFGGSDTGYLRLAGENINIRRFEIPLYSAEAVDGLVAAMNGVSGAAGLKAAIAAAGEISGLTKYADYARLYPTFKKYSTGSFAGIKAYADCAYATVKALERESECLNTVNAAAADNRWSIVRRATLEDYADLFDSGKVREDGISDIKSMWLKVCGNVRYESLDELTAAIAKAYREQKAKEATGKKDTGSDGGSVYLPGEREQENKPQDVAQFTDLEDAEWARESIEALAARGLVSGDGELFRPNDSITREEFVATLMRTARAVLDDADGIGEPFSDMEPGAWYEEDICAARALGIVAGKDDGSFGIGENITRTDMAVMAERAFRKLGADLTPKYAAYAYADSGKIPQYALDAVVLLQQCDVLGDAKSFYPSRKSTRAEAADLIWRLYCLCDAEEIDTEAGEYTELLTAIGALVEVANKDRVTRAEFAKMLAAAQNMKTGGKVGKTGFDDVSPSRADAAVICAIAATGEMAGVRGKFYPDSPVSPEDAVYALLVAAGYGLQLERGENVFALAKTAGIADRAYACDALGYNELCRLIYNMLECEIVATKDSKVDEFSKIKDYTALEKYFNIRKDRGVVTADAVTTLYEERKSFEPGYLKIDDTEYKGIDARPLLGKNVEFYYKVDDDATQEIVYVKEYKNKELVIDDDRIISCADGTLRYYKDADKSQSAKISLSSDTDIIYNGAAYPECDWGELELTSGRLHFIDNDSDGKYEVLRVYDTKHMIVGYSDASRRAYHDKENDLSLTLDSDDISYSFTVDGEPADISAVRTNMLLSYTESKSGKIFEIDASTTSVSGTIGAMDDDSITIEGAQVPINTKVLGAELSDFGMGDTAKLYISGGRGVRLEKDANDNEIVGYLTNVLYDIDNQIYFNVVTAKNTIKRFKGAKKVKIDMTEYTEAEDMAARLAETAVLSGGYRATAKYAQPVRVITNTAGEIKNIDTVYYDKAAEKDTSFVKSGDALINAVYFEANRGLYKNTTGHKATVGPNTKIIFVPYTNRNEPDWYTVTSTLGDTTTYDFEMFNVDSRRVPEYMYVYYNISTAVATTANVCVATKVSLEVDGNEVHRKVDWINATGEGTIYIGPDAKSPQIKSGDVIRYRENYSRILTVAEVLYSPSRNPIPAMTDRQKLFKAGTYDYNPQFGTRAVFGTVLERDDGFITLSPTTTEDEDGINVDDFTDYMVSEDTVYYKLTEKGTSGFNVARSDYYSLIPYEYDAKNATRAFVFIRYDQVAAVCFIAKED